MSTLAIGFITWFVVALLASVLIGYLVRGMNRDDEPPSPFVDTLIRQNRAARYGEDDERRSQTRQGGNHQ